MVKKDISMLIHQLISKRQNVTEILLQSGLPALHAFPKKTPRRSFAPIPVRAKDLRGLFSLPLFCSYFTLVSRLAFFGRIDLPDQNLLILFSACIAT
jgi:hypothetical protein